MAKIAYIGGGGNSSHKINKMYIGIDGVARKVKKGYIGDENGESRLFYSSTIYRWERYNVTMRYTWGQYTINKSYTWQQGTTKTQSVFRSASADYPTIVFEGDQRDVATLYTSSTPPSLNSDGNIRYPSGTYLGTINNLSEDLSFDCRNLQRYVYAIGTREIIGFYAARAGSDNVSGINLAPIRTAVLDVAYREWHRGESFDNLKFMYVDITPGTYAMTIYAVGGTQIEHKSRGTFIKNVQVDGNSNYYPKDGVSGDYWYTYVSEIIVKGSYVDTVTSDNENAYPDDGISGGYWCVKIT